ncbi:uncharacterized protein [Haliotis asinina]|uniref:uncharacterized protein n=1 Tax=Haliotis asinina TaxID=109174 RepID=UPI003532509D
MAVSPGMAVEEYEDKIQQAIGEVNTQNDKTVKSLYDLADELDKAQRKMNIAKTSFASGGIVAAALTIAGIACSLATLGASLGLTIAGVTLGVTSGVGGVSTEMANEIMNNKALEKAQQEANIYHKKGQTLLLLMENMRKEYGSKFKTFLMGKVKGKLNPKLFETISSHGTTAVKLVEKVGKAGTKGLKGGGIALCALTIPLNVYAIVTNSIKIHKKTTSATAEEIRRIAEELKDREAASVGEVQKLTRRVEEMERTQVKHRQAWNEAKKKIEEDITDEMESIAIEYEYVKSVFLRSKRFALIVEAIVTTVIPVFIAFNSGDEGWLSYFGKYALLVYDVFLFSFELFPILYGYSCLSCARAIWKQQTYAIENLIALRPGTSSREQKPETKWAALPSYVRHTFDEKKLVSNQNLFGLFLVVMKCMLTMYILFGSYHNVPQRDPPAQYDVFKPDSSLMVGLLFPLSVIPIESSDVSRPDLYILALAMTIFMLVKSYKDSNDETSDVATEILHLPGVFKARLGELMKRM